MGRLANPSDRIKRDTVGFVRKMANGGLEDPPELETPELDDGRVNGEYFAKEPTPSEVLVRKAHSASAGSKLMSYMVNKMKGQDYLVLHCIFQHHMLCIGQ